MQQTSFGYIRANIINQINESMLNGVKVNSALKQFKKLVSENEVLNLENVFYDNIEYIFIEDKAKATRHINNTLNLFSHINEKEFKDAHEKLTIFDSINNNLKELKNKDLYDAINNLIYESVKNKINFKPKVFSESFETILEYITKPKYVPIVEETKYDINKFIDIVFDKFNAKYKDLLSESEISIIKDFTFKDNSDKKILFENLKNEIINKMDITIKEELNHSDINDKEILDTIKLLIESITKLKSMTFNEDNLIIDISKLLDIKRNLE